LQYINGVIEQCLLGGEEGVITLGGGARATFLDCWSGSVLAEIPTIDLGGSGQELVVRNYSGGLRLRNKSGEETVSITLVAGAITLEPTITAGTIKISGVGTVANNSTGTAVVDTSDLLNPTTITDAVFAREVEAGLSFANSQRLIAAALAGVLSGADPGSTTITIKNARSGQPGAKSRIVATVDQYGNRSALVFDLTD
jgi:hypothetical protein